jgi:hypothetical protein
LVIAVLMMARHDEVGDELLGVATAVYVVALIFWVTALRRSR